MEQAFWRERWQRNEIGFHRATVHPALATFWPTLNTPAGTPVFVPLCGKALDMLWLRQRGYQVLGVETSALAVEAFFRENNLTPEISTRGEFQRYSIDDLSIWCGDFFDLSPQQLPNAGGVYDRAALIAMPAELRRRYARHLAALLRPGTTGLLVTLEYPPDEMAGPPFPVDEREVARLLANDFEITPLQRQDLLSPNDEEAARWRAKGLSRLEESVYRLDRKAPADSPAGGAIAR